MEGATRTRALLLLNIIIANNNNNKYSTMQQASPCKAPLVLLVRSLDLWAFMVLLLAERARRGR